MVAVTALARAIGGEPGSENEHTVEVGHITAGAIGIRTGRQEPWVDPRDGREVMRDVLEWLPRKAVRLVAGRLQPGATVRLYVPPKLAREKGLLEPVQVQDDVTSDLINDELGG